MKNGTAWQKRAIQRKETRQSILATIRSQGPLSRLDVSRRTNIRPSTVSHFVDALVREGFVKEVKRRVPSGDREPSVSVGRPPVLLELNPRIRMAIGIHMSKEGLRGLAIDLQGNTVASRMVRKRRFRGPDMLLAEIAGLARRIMAEARVPAARVLGLGLGLPGVVDPREGIARVNTQYRWWKDIPVRRRIERVLKVPILIENDTKVLTLAERWYGRGRGVPDMVFVELGEGIAAGLVINGELYHGAHGSAGELGHTVIDVKGPLCGCGRRGCLESHLALPRLRDMARSWLGESSAPRGRRAAAAGDGDIVARIASMAMAGHPRACRLVEMVGEHLGTAIVNLVHLVSPGLIVLGGSVGFAWRELLLPVVERAIREQALDDASRSTALIASTLGEEAGARGAAALALATQFDVV